MSHEKQSPIVVKIGGALLDRDAALEALWRELRMLQKTAPVVLVHGGGPQMTALAKRLDHTPRRVQGRRVTTDLDLEIAKWSMAGALNTQLVAEATAHDLSAVGLSGADAAQVQVEKRPPWTVDGETVDFGWVGDIEAVDPSLVESLLDQDVMPVVAPLSVDSGGQLYNVNADTVAGALAGALQARALYFVTGTGGVRRHADDPTTRIDTCTSDLVEQGVASGWIEGGMRVKLTTALDALRDGVRHAAICAADDLAGRECATTVVC